VAAVRYPPVGKRGVGLARAQGYGSSFETYKSWQESEAAVVVQVEHIEAVNNLEEILTTDGVDAYIVGPYDLSGSMGIPGEFEDSKFVEAMNRIRAIAEQLKVPGGVHLIEPNPAELLRLVEQGNEFIAYSLDIRMIDISCRTGLAQVKKVCK
jgi:2-dehydro-3-deoxyglucarate aldolase